MSLTPLHIKPEQHHIPVVDDVLLAFRADEPLFTSSLPSLISHEVPESDGFSANEAPFEIGVDDGGRFGGGVTVVDGPGSNLLLTGGEVGLEAQQVVGRTNEAIEPCRFDSE